MFLNAISYTFSLRNTAEKAPLYEMHSMDSSQSREGGGGESSALSDIEHSSRPSNKLLKHCMNTMNSMALYFLWSYEGLDYVGNQLINKSTDILNKICLLEEVAVEDPKALKVSIRAAISEVEAELKMYKSLNNTVQVRVSSMLDSAKVQLEDFEFNQQNLMGNMASTEFFG